MIHPTFPTQCLEEIVFAQIVKTVIVRYMDSMMSVPLTVPDIVENFDMVHSTTSEKYDSLAISTREEVENVLARKDTSESVLRASFCRALSFSIPPPTFYRNYCPGAHSDLIFGAPLVDLVTNQDNVSKVMRICIDEVEKRGLDTKSIYLVSQSCMYWPWDSCSVSQTGHPYSAEVLQAS
jgi:hypothetical protein